MPRHIPRRSLKFGLLAIMVVAILVAIGGMARGVPDTPDPPEPDMCGELTAQLQDLPAKAVDRLTTVPPDLEQVTDLLFEALGVTGELQEEQCLPALPPEEDTDDTECLALHLDLISQLTATLSTLVTDGGLANVTEVIAGVEGLSDTIAELVDSECLPEPAE
jgi:hypothetical protein